MERTNRKIFNLTPLQVAVLLVNIHKGAQDPDVGFEDADNTLLYLTKSLQKNRTIRVYRSQLESALWSCNMMDEQGKFWAPYVKSHTFDQFVDSLSFRAYEQFDKNLHLILKKDFQK